MQNFDENETPDPSECVEGEAPDVNGDFPDTQQVFMAVTSQVLKEYNRANTIYPEYYHSSAEALGVLIKRFDKVKQLLMMMKVVRSKTYNDDYEALSKALFFECCKLSVVIMKIVMSLYDTGPLTQAFSEEMRRQQEIAQLIKDSEQDDAADEPTI
jgi:hypothetical protein